MQKLNRLWQITNAASTVRDLAQHTKTYHFAIRPPGTVYLQAEYADVTIVRWNRPNVEITTVLQAPFGWRIATEQDDAGVYMVARRRAMIGGFSTAKFVIRLPDVLYLTLKLSECSISLRQVTGAFEFAPTQSLEADEPIFQLLESNP